MSTTVAGITLRRKSSLPVSARWDSGSSTCAREQTSTESIPLEVWNTKASNDEVCTPSEERLEAVKLFSTDLYLYT